jgi:beta-glucanase (GH16 family)
MNRSNATALIAIAPLLIATADDIRPLNTDGSITGYTLVWHDEFDGSAVDTKEWNYRTGERLLSFQKKENVSVSDGAMHLALKKENEGKLHYTAGGLISKRGFKYGYFEARFRCPKAAGWHTSFWTMSYNAPKTPGEDYAASVESGKAKSQRAQEIDICEQDAANHRSYSAGVIDWSGQHGKKSENFGRVYYRDNVPDFSADFHVWGC